MYHMPVVVGHDNAGVDKVDYEVEKLLVLPGVLGKYLEVGDNAVEREVDVALVGRHPLGGKFV